MPLLQQLMIADVADPHQSPTSTAVPLSRPPQVVWSSPGCELQTKDAQDIPALFLGLPEMDSERSLSDELKQQCIQEIAHIFEILGFFVQR